MVEATAPAPDRDSGEAAFLGVEHSATERRWRLDEGDERLAQAHIQALGVPDMVGRILASRGVSPEEGEAYLNPTLKSLLPDPSVLKDMDKAAERLAEAVAGGEKVAVFGDYDVDGATSSALLKRFFNAVGGKLRVYIPDRIKEGYGPNTPALKSLAEEGATVVVTVDCGVSAFEPLEWAAGAGLDVVIVDHHEAEAGLPPAHAVINPNRLDEDRSLGHLAAVGVAFLLVIATNRALRQRGWFDQRPEPDLMQWLDIVALGTVCDVVPLLGLNRALVTQGLKVLAARRNSGLKALADVAGIDRKPEVYHLGFVLGPRINAGGRVGKSDLGSILLASDDAAEVSAIAGELEKFNAERRAIEAMVLEEAIAQVESREQESGDRTPLVIASATGWHPGVIGIVASRLKDRFGRPAMVLAFDEDGIGKGSGRSVRGVDLGSAVIAARQAGLLVNGGGHPMAAGVTLTEDRLEAFSEFLIERLADQVRELGAARSLRLDGALSLQGATADFVDLLEQVGPFGSGNAEPRFALAAVKVIKASIVGQNHVSCIFSSRDGGRLKGIAFRTADLPLGQCLLGAVGREIHVAGKLRADNWQGRRDAQLFIDDAAEIKDALGS